MTATSNLGCLPPIPHRYESPYARADVQSTTRVTEFLPLPNALPELLHVPSDFQQLRRPVDIVAGHDEEEQCPRLPGHPPGVLVFISPEHSDTATCNNNAEGTPNNAPDPQTPHKKTAPKTHKPNPNPRT